MHYIHLLYNKTIVDLCFGRHGVLLNSKLNHNDLRSTSVKNDVYCLITLHAHLNISQKMNSIVVFVSPAKHGRNIGIINPWASVSSAVPHFWFPINNI